MILYSAHIRISLPAKNNGELGDGVPSNRCSNQGADDQKLQLPSVSSIILYAACLLAAGCSQPQQTTAHREPGKHPNPAEVECQIRTAFSDLSGVSNQSGDPSLPTTENASAMKSNSATKSAPITKGDAVQLVFAVEGDASSTAESPEDKELTKADSGTDAPKETMEPKDSAESNKPGKFDGEISREDIDLDEDSMIDPSASDWTNAELVPTPVPQKEVVAEIVPTPVGMPELALAELESSQKPRVSPRTRADVVAVTPIVPGDAPVTPIRENEDGAVLSPSNVESNRTKLKIRMASDRSASSPLIGKPDPESGDFTSESKGLTGEAMAVPSNSEVGTGPVDYSTWAKPAVTLFVTGQQHGYIEPCGCTGLENQKGGVARRMTFLNQLKDQGWEMLPIDAGNLIRRVGPQANIKYHRSLEALRKMGYVALGFGPDDVRITPGDLIQEAFAENPEDSVYASANVVLIDPSLMPSFQMIEREGMKIAVTSILEPQSVESSISEDIILSKPQDAAIEVMKQMKAANPDYTVLTYYGEDETAKELVRAVPGFDLMVVAGGYGEPTYQPEDIEGSSTKMILTGNKGMYAGLVALYRDDEMKYARVPLTHEFEDASEMRQLMADYQFQLRDLGLENLGLKPIPHPSGREFVGSETCGECHTTAYDIWQGSAHFEATEHLVNPGERGDVPRHFDPECISCHVTGWDPQNYFPYKSGYLDLEADSHLHGNGCENCHGPGAAHAAAESGDDDVSDVVRAELRKAMQLPLDDAREKCMECHDLDNSPDFHEEGAFDDYWAEVEHYGLD